MYQDRLHAPDAVVPEMIRNLKAKLADPYRVVEALRDAGCMVSADSSGEIEVVFGSERCRYPLGVTEITRDDRARESYEAV